ncbi:MAG: hypothetical protein US39_C0001G0078 [Microgenomates group bacterium GW2011_GWC1_37_12b]|uniref:Uncharacterized protein n=1 Tax=Candidatus Woesebacteria bacterium GW2011_GWB1_38_8b TaxID=1618571 RepID=A0A0G0NKA7_9BACT|nr:MAG: hypothetical protein US39_C0001G0078 [Microgenomates group bacterium GW2011_GWC1_37_12b]KKQ86329.1 MAG: hypothetical protein UT10_C0029G0009 [Candidatus Woesebacteria bacterium GW2011_GWB1_38_8b]
MSETYQYGAEISATNYIINSRSGQVAEVSKDILHTITRPEGNFTLVVSGDSLTAVTKVKESVNRRIKRGLRDLDGEKPIVHMPTETEKLGGVFRSSIIIYLGS